jgi:hypothetical protein
VLREELPRLHQEKVVIYPLSQVLAVSRDARLAVGRAGG